MSDQVTLAPAGQPLKIALLTNYHLEQVGGAEEVLDRLAQLWTQAGHRVTLFAAPARRRPKKTRAWNPTYPVVRLPRVRSTRFGLGRPARILKRAHAKQAFDLVFASDAYWAGHVARLCWQATGAPYVLCSHGSDIMHGSRFLNRRTTRLRMSEAIRDAAGISYISQYMQTRTHELAQPRGVERMIPNGWPDEWQTLDAPPRRVAGPYVFAMGRVVRLKGFQTLIEAFARLRASYRQLPLIIAGEGDYLQTLAEHANSLGLPVKRGLPEGESPGFGVYLPGFLLGEAKRSVLYHASVVVSSSIRQEPMSLVLFEALSCGVPVIGSRVGGTPDIIQPGINGYLFEPENSEELALRLDETLRRQDRRDQLARQAAQSVADFRWSKISEVYQRYFCDVLQAQRARRERSHAA